MNYIDPAEYLGYGLSEETPDSLVAAASAMIDGYCRRPSLGVTVYVERLRVGRDRQTVRLSHGPVVSADGVALPVTACRVRLSRIRGEFGLFGDASWPGGYALQALQQEAAIFGLGGQWATVDPSTVVLYANGEAELPWNFFSVPFDEVELTYTAGFAVVPAAVKTACAQIVKNAAATPAVNVRKQQMDSMRMEYFGASLLDDEVKRMLRPYVAMRLG